jgi:hypothetical protein
MNEIQIQVGSPGWWFTTVFVGIIIGCIPAYLKPWIDRASSRAGLMWRTRSKFVEDKFNERAYQLATSAQLLQSEAEEEMRNRLRSIHFSAFVIMGILVISLVNREGVNSAFFNGCAAFTVGNLLMTIWSHWDATKGAMLVRVARRMRVDLVAPINSEGGAP